MNCGSKGGHRIIVDLPLARFIRPFARKVCAASWNGKGSEKVLSFTLPMTPDMKPQKTIWPSYTTDIWEDCSNKPSLQSSEIT